MNVPRYRAVCTLIHCARGIFCVRHSQGNTPGREDISCAGVETDLDAAQFAGSRPRRPSEPRFYHWNGTRIRLRLPARFSNPSCCRVRRVANVTAMPVTSLRQGPSIRWRVKASASALALESGCVVASSGSRVWVGFELPRARTPLGPCSLSQCHRRDGERRISRFQRRPVW